MDLAIIFDVQRFSLHDGPGIRTTVFFKGCPLRCAWCQNPESWEPGPEIAFYEHLCRQCFTCLTVCEEQAIFKQADQRVDYGRCSACGKCADACVDDALRVVGRAWTVSDLVAELHKDVDYFETSGGGVTLSGGEPMLQAEYLRELLPELKKRKTHVTLETCGLFNWRGMESLLPFLDLVYYDLKIMAADAHERLTGTVNGPVLENFTRLFKADVALQARMPVIPDINDGEANIRDTAGFLLENGQASIHLLPYHNMGEAKIPRLHT
ncbi:MAG: glycyl-radical enzyme activating protein, partial [Desulfobacterales bacterium]|nr:glycyl-radical enzyme activating protein [Desulfobacterales bacterium]